MRLAAESTAPLVHVAAASGGSYLVRRANWLAARAGGLPNVPLCDEHGQPVPEGARSRLRLSTIEAGTLTPRQVQPTEAAAPIPPPAAASKLPRYVLPSEEEPPSESQAATL